MYTQKEICRLSHFNVCEYGFKMVLAFLTRSSLVKRSMP